MVPVFLSRSYLKAEAADTQRHQCAKDDMPLDANEALQSEELLQSEGG